MNAAGQRVRPVLLVAWANAGQGGRLSYDEVLAPFVLLARRMLEPFQEEEIFVRIETHLKNHRLTRALQKEVERRERAEAALTKADQQLSILSEQEARRWGVSGFRRNSASPRSLDMSKAHSVARRRIIQAARPTAELCFSMRSAICRWTCRRSFSVSSRTAWSSPSVHPNAEGRSKSEFSLARTRNCSRT